MKILKALAGALFRDPPLQTHHHPAEKEKRRVARLSDMERRDEGNMGNGPVRRFHAGEFVLPSWYAAYQELSQRPETYALPDGFVTVSRETDEPGPK